ncbi:Aste57867_23639 [Aphanomyces stellatus]|uniref:COP9 signalosome complex subunit 3 n=1 Tax=Aphanomyces stellatus TaxID=120398 RepID=A0A485LN72_9STRA|nr:hypothetical protein As57867_023567 [Aphanomyces stellatus]VFU00284.1 Aste57867_23639 [Aphanomyces stellatus]
MSSIAEFVLTHCKNTSVNLDSGDLPKALVTVSIEELDNTLECLNTDDYAAAMAYLLAAKGKKLPKLHVQDDEDEMDMHVDQLDAPDRTLHVTFLLQVCSYVGRLRSLPTEPRETTKLSDLVKLAVHVGIALGQTIRLVHPLRQLILFWQNSKLESSSITHANKYALTPFHGSFALACLHAKCYHAALPILNQPIFEVAMPHAIQSIHVLEYFYYGGMLFTGLKQFRDASTFFLTAITSPAHALSAIAIEAYKKYILVSLLATGDVPPLPKSAPLIVSRNIDSHVAPFLAFATAFKSLDIVQLHDSAADISGGGHGGLVKQCIAALKKKRVQQLTLTYTTVSLAKLAAEIGATDVEAESCLLDMIEARDVAAAIEKRENMVVFHAQDDVDEVLLQSMIENTVMSTTRLREMDVAVTKNPKYIGKVKDKRASKYTDTDESTWLGATQHASSSG